MNETNSGNSVISGGQLAAMLLITDAFVLLCFNGSASVLMAAGLAAGTLLQLLLSLPLAMMYSKGKNRGRLTDLLYLPFVIIFGGSLLNMLWQAAEAVYIPYENSGGISGKLLITGAAALVCLYISSAGVKAFSRAAVIAAASGGVCIAIAAMSAFFRSDIDNLRRAVLEGDFFHEVIRGIAMSGSIAGFAVMLRETGGGQVRNTVRYFAAKAVLAVTVTMTAVLVAGGIMPISDFPMITAAQLSQPFTVQRTDSLFLIVFAVFAVFSIAFQIVTAAYLMKSVIPGLSKYRSTISILLTIAAAAAMYRIEICEWAAAAAVLLILVIPEIILEIRGRS